MGNIFKFLTAVAILCTGLSCCSRYIDDVRIPKSTTIMDGRLSFYPDSNILIYKNSTGLKNGNKVVKPKSFKITLPKGLQNYTFSNSQSFTFNYDSHQVLFIYIDLTSDVKPDSSYEPDKTEIAGFIQKYVTYDQSKYTLSNIPLIEKRKQKIIRKAGSTLLLFNLKPENEVAFNKAAQSLEIGNISD